MTCLRISRVTEKRQFKLYVGRLEGNEDSKFLQLFNVLDKLTTYQEEHILSKTGISKRQLPISAYIDALLD